MKIVLFLFLYLFNLYIYVGATHVPIMIDSKEVLWISSEIKSSLFQTGITQGLAPSTVAKLVSIYESIGVDFTKDILPKSKISVLYEKSSETREKILYTSLKINKKEYNLYYYKLLSGYEGYFNHEGIALKQFIHPLNTEHRISSKFGNRKHPIHGNVIFHKGIDYAAKLGTPIHAAADGIIEYIGQNGGYGKYIKLKHVNNYLTCYAHMSKFSGELKLGSKVKQGQVIAYVGSTGIATGPHLHYEVIYRGKHIDPLMLKDNTGIKLPEHESEKFKLAIDTIDNVINKSVRKKYYKIFG